MSHISTHNSVSSTHSEGSLVSHEFPEEDLRPAGRHNPGYFPVRLGLQLHANRYAIVRKLGWGQYSSVWLAKDRQEAKGPFVALKILTCEGTKALADGPDQHSDELRMLQKIATAQPAHRGFRHNLAYIDIFEFTGPHGLHRCIVTEALGHGVENLRMLQDGQDRHMNVSIVKRLLKQILLGLEYLHNVCGIVHADLKHDNILLRPRDVNSVIALVLAHYPSFTYNCGTEIIPTVVPVKSQGLPLDADLVIREQDLEAVIADFGHSHWQERHFQESIQPAALRAPEVILGHPWSTPADIWNLGCLVVEWLTGGWLFHPAPPDYAADHLFLMTLTLGVEFTPSFLAKCADRNKFFKADGTFAHDTTRLDPTMSLRDELEKCSELGDDLDLAERFLRRCLTLDPAERATATELIDDPWLANVAC